MTERTLSQIQQEVHELLERNSQMLGEIQKDKLLRLSILVGQVGQFSRVIYHGEPYVKGAIQVGDFKGASQDLMIQLLLLLDSCGVDIEQAYQGGYARIKELVFMQKPIGVSLKELPIGVVEGKSACVKSGFIIGVVRIVDAIGEARHLSYPYSSEIWVTEELSNEGVDKMMLKMKTSSPDTFGVVVQNAGYTSHIANVCRDMGIRCLVLTTSLKSLREGDTVTLDCSHTDGKLEVVK